MRKWERCGQGSQIWLENARDERVKAKERERGWCTHITNYRTLHSSCFKFDVCIQPTTPTHLFSIPDSLMHANTHSHTHAQWVKILSEYDSEKLSAFLICIIYVWPFTPCLYVKHFTTAWSVHVCIWTKGKWHVIYHLKSMSEYYFSHSSHTHTHTLLGKKKKKRNALITHCSLGKLNICGLIGTEFQRYMLRNVK